MNNGVNATGASIPSNAANAPNGSAEALSSPPTNFNSVFISQNQIQFAQNNAISNGSNIYHMQEVIDTRRIPGSIDILQRGNLPSIKVKQHEVQYEYHSKDEIIMNFNN